MRKLKKLIKARKDAGMTQEELGKALSIPSTNVSGWENLKRPIPMQHWKKISQILSISYEEIQNIAEELHRIIKNNDTTEERIAFINKLSDYEYTELVNAYEEKRLDLSQIAKIDDLENFRDRAISGIARMDIPAEIKGKVIDFLSKLEQMGQKK